MYPTRDDFWVLTVYFNPCGYKSRRSTYEAFMRTMRDSKVNVLVVECAFGDQPYELPESHDVIKVRGDSLLWQKERLLNIGASYLPPSAKYVAWVDCDVVFDNRNWVLDACELLEHEAPVVQLFETAMRLGYGNVETDDIVTSFAKRITDDPTLFEAQRYDAHGHTGYGWAMRRELFDDIGLYEFGVVGNADHYMAHAIFGVYNHCITNALRNDPVQIEHLKAWSDKFHARVRGKVAAVPGMLRHLWHGKLENRDYFKRQWKVTEAGWNPDTDIQVFPGKPLCWCPHVHEQKPSLVSYFASYFESRQEDVA